MTSKNQQLAEITTNISLNMDDLVNVFVSDHESALDLEKARLHKAITDTRKTIESFNEQQIAAFTKQYDKATKLSPGSALNTHLYEAFKSVNLDYENRTASIVMTVFTKQSNTRLGQYSFTVALKASTVKQYTTLTTQQNELTTELQDVLHRISSISKTERKIRGFISRQKLESSGMTDLLKNTQLKKLTAL